MDASHNLPDSIVLLQKEFRVQSDTVAYGATLSACEKGLEWEILDEHDAGLLRLCCASAMSFHLDRPKSELHFVPVSVPSKPSACAKAHLLDRKHVQPLCLFQKQLVSICWLMHGSARPRIAVHLLAEMCMLRVQLSIVACSSVLTACEKAGQWLWALSLLADLHLRRMRVDVIAHNAAISACGRCSAWQWSCQLLQELLIGAMSPSSVTCNSCLGACGAGFQWQRALQVSTELDRGLRRDTITYNSAISACQKARQWQQALYLGRDVRTQTITTTAITYATTIAACGEEGLWQSAFRLLCEQKQEQLELSVASSGAAISACGQGNQWEQALQLVEQSIEACVQSTVVMFSAVMTACESWSLFRVLCTFKLHRLSFRDY